MVKCPWQEIPGSGARNGEFFVWRESGWRGELRCSHRFIAAEQPPSLACMAPWEGLGDYYRESICRGGIPDHAFWDVLMSWFNGESLNGIHG